MWDESLGSVLDALPVGVLWIDAEGVLVRANRPGLEYLGLADDARGRERFADLLPNEALREAVSPRAPGTVRLSFSDGSRALEAEVRRMPAGGEEGRLLVVRDVTGTANLARIRQNLFFDLLHRVRSPLTTVVSVLSLAASGRLDPSKVDLGEFLGMGMNEADRLALLLSRLKDLYLTETGGMGDDLVMEPTDLRTVADEEIAALKKQHAAANHEVRVTRDDEPVRVRGDRAALGRAIRMVAENAFRYTPAGGPIHVTVQGMGSQAEIRVEDGGPGIPEDELPFVFDRFFRGAPRTVPPVPGEGLGLYLARHVVGLHGGSILLDSRVGSGTVAEILLPALGGDS